MTDIDARLTQMLATRDKARDAKDFFLDLADLVARGAAETLGRQQDEVGILIAGRGDSYLRFAAPRKFCDLGTIPTSKRDSIAVAVFNRKTGEANNPERRTTTFLLCAMWLSLRVSSWPRASCPS